MERDALISHGAAFVVRDRLLACSDICSADLCSTCGSMLTSQRVAPSATATTLQQVMFPFPLKCLVQFVLPPSRSI
jgi:DNA-directed RNA polymerase beta subunit